MQANTQDDDAGSSEWNGLSDPLDDATTAEDVLPKETFHSSAMEIAESDEDDFDLPSPRPFLKKKHESIVERQGARHRDATTKPSVTRDSESSFTATEKDSQSSSSVKPHKTPPTPPSTMKRRASSIPTSKDSEPAAKADKSVHPTLVKSANIGDWFQPNVRKQNHLTPPSHESKASHYRPQLSREAQDLEASNAGVARPSWCGEPLTTAEISELPEIWRKVMGPGGYIEKRAIQSVGQVQCRRCKTTFNSLIQLAYHELRGADGVELFDVVGGILGPRSEFHIHPKENCKIPRLQCYFQDENDDDDGCEIDSCYDRLDWVYGRALSDANAFRTFWNVFDFEFLWHQQGKESTGSLRLPCICGLHFPGTTHLVYHKLCQCAGKPLTFWQWAIYCLGVDTAAKTPTTGLQLRIHPQSSDEVKPPTFVEAIKQTEEPGPIIVAFDRNSKEIPKHAFDAWNSTMHEHQMVTGLDIPALHVLMGERASDPFPILPGNDEFTTWLKYDSEAVISLQDLVYSHQAIWPLVCEILLRRKPEDRFATEFEDSFTCSNHSLASFCATRLFTFDWACRKETILNYFKAINNKSFTEKLEQLDSNSESQFLGQINDYFWLRFSSCTVAKVFAGAQADPLVSLMFKVNDWRQGGKDKLQSGRTVSGHDISKEAQEMRIRLKGHAEDIKQRIHAQFGGEGD